MDNNAAFNVFPYNVAGATWTVAGTIDVTNANTANTILGGRTVTLNNGTLESAAGTNTTGYGEFYANNTIIIATGAGNTISGGSVGISSVASGGGTGVTFNTPLATDMLSVSSALGATGTATEEGPVTKTRTRHRRPQQRQHLYRHDHDQRRHAAGVPAPAAARARSEAAAASSTAPRSRLTLTGTLSVANAISGSGEVQQIGGGTTTLTASNSYQGTDDQRRHAGPLQCQQQ